MRLELTDEQKEKGVIEVNRGDLRLQMSRKKRRKQKLTEDTWVTDEQKETGHTEANRGDLGLQMSRKKRGKKKLTEET